MADDGLPRDPTGAEPASADCRAERAAVPLPSSPAGEVTRILGQAARGSACAAEQLLPLVYDELRRLAARRLSGEKPGQTLQATALVHEAYVRLVGSERALEWDSRNHFFVAASEAMRRILVESARRKATVRRGGDFRRQDRDMESLPVAEADAQVLAVHDALEQLAAERPAIAKLVELRYFGGLTLAEAAALLDISQRTYQRHWAYARAWLYDELARGPHGPERSGAAEN